MQPEKHESKMQRSKKDEEFSDDEDIFSTKSEKDFLGSLRLDGGLPKLDQNGPSIKLTIYKELNKIAPLGNRQQNQLSNSNRLKDSFDNDISLVDEKDRA